MILSNEKGMFDDYMYLHFMKTIKHLLTVFVISSAPLLYSNCFVEENDLASQQCESRCTVIRGRITTDGMSRGVANVPLELFWEHRPMFGGILRKKAQATTDAQGNYQFRFLLRDDELLYGMHYTEMIGIDNDVFIQQAYSEIDLPYLQSDTLYEIGSFVLPKRAFVKLIVENQNMMAEGDYVHITMGYQSGLEPEIGNFSRKDFSKTSAASDWLAVAGNQPVYVWLERKKGGVKLEKRDTLFVRARARTEYRIDFTE